MYAAVIPGVAAYLLCPALGKGVLCKTNNWLPPSNVWCDSCCCKVCHLKTLLYFSGPCGITYFWRKSCIRAFGSFTAISYSFPNNSYFILLILQSGYCHVCKL